MQIPDVAGFTLGEAIELINRTGLNIRHVRVTAPPRLKHGGYNESYRVIKLETVNRKEIDLLVCNPDIV